MSYPREQTGSAGSKWASSIKLLIGPALLCTSLVPWPQGPSQSPLVSREWGWGVMVQTMTMISALNVTENKNQGMLLHFCWGNCWLGFGGQFARCTNLWEPVSCWFFQDNSKLKWQMEEKQKDYYHFTHSLECGMGVDTHTVLVYAYVNPMYFRIMVIHLAVDFIAFDLKSRASFWRAGATYVSRERNYRVVVSKCFKTVFFTPNLGKWSNLTNIFWMGWNHRLDSDFFLCFE